MKTKSEKSGTGSMTSEHKTKIMHELFESQLRDIYWAEKELTAFMPKIISKLTSRELIDVIEEHIETTRDQITRLEKVFVLLGSKARAEKCEAMAGLIKEAEGIIDESEEGIIRDAFIIGAVQKVEHYETASYGTLKSLAIILGEYEVATLLGETLKEEKEADEKLTDVAENIVNIEASREAGDLEEEEAEEEYEYDDNDEEDEEEYEGSQGKSKSSRKH